MHIKGQIVAIEERRIYTAELFVEAGRIRSITPLPDDPSLPFILPGFVDAHIHIESSMLIPAEFARLAVVHGTVATVSDPHEIANVCGIEGVEFMIANGKSVPFKFNFGAPSCVPATTFETAGAALDSKAVADLMQREEILYLSEMMNFPGVLHNDPEVMAKIQAAHAVNKPVDGHAPGLRGEEAKRYIEAGISTDHECFTSEEALDKLQHGMKILIREGSAARNFEALIGLLNDYPDQIMFCSDDKHPDSLVLGHINELCARAVAKGIDVFKVLQAACINPVRHYRLPVGLLQEGDPADFIMTSDLTSFKVHRTFINGNLVAEDGESGILHFRENKEWINRFSCTEKTPADFRIPYKGEKEIPVIEALDGQLITNKLFFEPKVNNNEIVSDAERDILKIVVVNRYQEAPIAKAFIRNMGFRRGAIASTVAHDSHNIVAVGVDNESLCSAVNALVRCQGGVSYTDGTKELVLPLPVGGLMSGEDGYVVAQKYGAIDQAAKALGSSLAAPYMTLSFMALLVIPHLKLSDKGLFDGDRFELIGG